jgi:hypothetical protein
LAEQVEAVAIELRINREKVFLAIVHAVATIEIARRGKSDALTRLRHERTRAVEEVRAAPGRIRHIPAAWSNRHRRHAVVSDEEQSGIGDRGEADVIVVASVRNTVASRRVGVDHHEIGIVAVGAAVGGEPRILLGKFHVERDVAAVIHEVGAAENAAVVVTGITFVARASLAAELQSREVFLENEVDHARDGVGAVHSGIAAGHDIDAVDEVGGERVHIRRYGIAENVRAHMATAVDQNQRALGAKATQIEQVETGSSQEAAGVRLAERAAQCRQVVQKVSDRGSACLEQLLTRNRGHGHRRYEIGTGKTGTRDDDFVHRLFVGLVLGNYE